MRCIYFDVKPRILYKLFLNTFLDKEENHVDNAFYSSMFNYDPVTQLLSMVATFPLKAVH